MAGGATLRAKQVTLLGAGASPINGCQGGVGIQVGMAWTTPVEVGHATLNDDAVSEYQKNGITVDGAGSSAKIVRATVVGAGETHADRPERHPDQQWRPRHDQGLHDRTQRVPRGQLRPRRMERNPVDGRALLRRRERVERHQLAPVPQ